jgi:hypothetical protein
VITDKLQQDLIKEQENLNASVAALAAEDVKQAAEDVRQAAEDSKQAESLKHGARFQMRVFVLEDTFGRLGIDRC